MNAFHQCPADRTDLLEQYKARYDVFNEYAPKLLSEDEVRDITEAKGNLKKSPDSG